MKERGERREGKRRPRAKNVVDTAYFTEYELSPLPPIRPSQSFFLKGWVPVPAPRTEAEAAKGRCSPDC